MSDDLRRLPNMSPIQGYVIPTRSGDLKRPSWITMQVVMVLFGTGLMLVSSFFLFVAVGPALEANPDDPAYWFEVVDRMFGVEYGGFVIRPAACGLLLGIGLVILGLRNHQPHATLRAPSVL